MYVNKFFVPISTNSLSRSCSWSLHYMRESTFDRLTIHSIYNMNGGIGGRDSASVINMIHKQTHTHTKCLVMLVNIYYGRSIGSPYIQFIAGVQFPFVESLFWVTNA